MTGAVVVFRPSPGVGPEPALLPHPQLLQQQPERLARRPQQHAEAAAGARRSSGERKGLTF
jgi:hypothetical protein